MNAATGQCPSCNTANAYTNIVCEMCGVRLPWAAAVKSSLSSVQPPGAPQAVADSPNVGMAILGFFLPIVGLILFLVWRDTTPQRAASAGKGALAGVGFSALSGVVVFLSLLSLGRRVIPAVVNPAVSIPTEQSGRDEETVSHLKQVALGIAQFSMDYDEKFPSLASASTVKSELQPYLKGSPQVMDILLADSSGKPFLFNASLAGQPMPVALGKRDLQDVIVVYQDTPSGSWRYVAYADGHVKHISPSTWTEQATFSGIQ